MTPGHRHVERQPTPFLGGFFSAGAFVIAARVVPARCWRRRRRARRPTRRRWTRASIWASTPTAPSHRHPPLGDGHRHPHDAADGRRRRARGRLGARPIEQGLGDAKYGDQNTDGSSSIRDFYDAMRVAGASARPMLEQAAAAQWRVPVARWRPEPRRRPHAERATRSGTAAGDRGRQIAGPRPPRRCASRRSDYRFIGKTAGITDLDDFVTRQGPFGIDAHMPGMVYAAIARPPVLGGEAARVDDAAA